MTLELKKDKQLDKDGFRIRHTSDGLTITSPDETGLLYGAYHLLRLQTLQSNDLKTDNEIIENPAYQLRILNHWDNMQC